VSCHNPQVLGEDNKSLISLGGECEQQGTQGHCLKCWQPFSYKIQSSGTF